MEQIPNWLNDAVQAAGMAAVYNADDWDAATVDKTLPLPFLVIPA